MRQDAENMRKARKILAIFIYLITLLIPASGFTQTNIGLWNAEDCEKISAASGYFLHMSGELLKESDEKRKEGDEANADKLAQSALYLSDLATNYAKNFEVYCKQ